MTRRASLQSARFASSGHATHTLLLAMLMVVRQVSPADRRHPCDKKRHHLLRLLCMEDPETTRHPRSSSRPWIKCRPARVACECPTLLPNSRRNVNRLHQRAVPRLSPFCPLVASSISSEDLVFPPHTSGGWFSGDSRSSPGAMAALRWWNVGLGEAIWSDSGGHGIAQGYPDLCSGDDLASGSSILLLAQENSHCAGWYAATRVVVTRKDDGDPAFNTSEFLGSTHQFAREQLLSG